MSKPSIAPLEDHDKFIREYVKDQAKFVLCCVYEDKKGNEYTMCADQDGHEWIEDYEG
jgi:hypothetical protein